MKKTPVLIANAIIVVLTLTFVVLYIQKDDQRKILENTENFTSMSIGMELVTTNYLEGEQRLFVPLAVLEQRRNGFAGE